ncbi:PREDICTED: coiled-coil domain-containing protein 62 [Nanorana parkeri]|uniref:coiled-coil domain-containing protein 62 n=1 Tax=Nanorana parkeri TaxID=125878 RepID=UPI0008543981|nr:PREDICTED: coiled-coil domain-containing protein 62 [Nanorana parkeri]
MNNSDLLSPKFLSSDLENSTIQKQRKELQLLIAELKDRDKELNDIVSLQQRQLLAWQNDRPKILTLEQKCARLESDLQKRNNIIKSLTKRIQFLEEQHQDRRTNLENTQQQLQELSLVATEANNHCHDLEEKNRRLSESVLELSAQVGQLQAREQELSTLLKLKDADIIEATEHIREFTSRFKDLDAELRKTRRRETTISREAQDLTPKLKGLKTEVHDLKDDLSQKTVENNEQREEIIRLKQESAYLQAELVFAAEREKRKDQLLQLAKSKKDRTDIELQNLRQIYMKQQHDLQFLHVNLEANDKAQADADVSGPLNLSSLVSDERDEFLGSCQSLRFNLLDLKPPLMQSSLRDSGPLKWQQNVCSPTMKLQRLLVESRQLVADIELSSLLSTPDCTSSQVYIAERLQQPNIQKNDNIDTKHKNSDSTCSSHVRHRSACPMHRPGHPLSRAVLYVNICPGDTSRPRCVMTPQLV